MGCRKDYQSPQFRTKRISDFWARVDKSAGPGGCWMWQGAVLNTGYGRVHMCGKEIDAHRLAYDLRFGISDGKFVLHHCDNKLCCNPLHLFLGTQKDNIEDAVKKGRNPRGATHGMAFLTSDQVDAIRRRYRFRVITQAMLASEFGVSEGTINRILKRKSWK